MDVGRMFVAANPTGVAFGVWEAKAHTGAGVFNEYAADCGNELHTRGYTQAQDFYATAFGWTHTEIGAATPSSLPAARTASAASTTTPRCR
jgi:predicted enzyme related to lactoylglutathione lyase